MSQRDYFEKDYYQTLGVDRKASEKEIRSAYRRLARKHHPDKLVDIFHTDVNDPHDAIMGAARYLAANGGSSGDIDNALYRYNNSNKYVRGVKHYASIMTTNPRAFHGFYHWQVIYLSELGDIWLPTGYEQAERVAAADYIAANPTHHLGTDTT
jgi:hypothetical protein